MCLCCWWWLRALVRQSSSLRTRPCSLFLSPSTASSSPRCIASCVRSSWWRRLSSLVRAAPPCGHPRLPLRCDIVPPRRWLPCTSSSCRRPSACTTLWRSSSRRTSSRTTAITPQSPLVRLTSAARRRWAPSQPRRGRTRTRTRRARRTRVRTTAWAICR